MKKFVAICFFMKQGIGYTCCIRHSSLVSVALIAASAHFARVFNRRTGIYRDRPDFTEAAVVIGRRRFQIESGFTSERGRGGRSLGLPEVLIRYGVSERWEVRFAPANYNQLRNDNGETVSGFGDTYVGAKYQVGPLRDGTEVSLIPAFFVPRGQRGMSSGGIDPELKICAARAIGGGRSLSGMIYLAYPSDDGRRNYTQQHTLSLGQPITPRIGSFFEFSNVIPQRGAPENLLHLGFTYQPMPRQQFDLHFGFGLNDAAPKDFIAGGYSINY